MGLGGQRGGNLTIEVPENLYIFLYLEHIYNMFWCEKESEIPL